MKSTKKRAAPPMSDLEEAAIQRAIAEDPENPEWTDEDFARARPAKEVLPPKLYAALVRNSRDSPRRRSLRSVPVALDSDVVEKFRASGADWESRINQVLRKAVGL